jgi:hypothetical protein
VRQHATFAHSREFDEEAEKTLIVAADVPRLAEVIAMLQTCLCRFSRICSAHLVKKCKLQNYLTSNENQMSMFLSIVDVSPTEYRHVQDGIANF